RRRYPVVRYRRHRHRIELTATVRKKIVLTQPPPYKTFLNDSIYTISVLLKAKGFNLLRHLVFNKDEVIYIPVNSLLNTTNFSNNSMFYISGNDIIKSIFSFSENYINVSNINPDTISFILDNVKEKIIDIKPLYSIKLNENYIYKTKPYLYPDYAKISGPKTIIDTLQYLYTEPFEITNFSGILKNKVSIIIPRGIKADINKTIIKAETEKFTEKTIRVPIQIIQPENFAIETDEQFVEVTLRVGISNYASIIPDSFLFQVNYNPTLELLLRKIPITLVQYPKEIEIIHYKPQETDYIIKPLKK
ncbi:MAG: hypothetical protein SNJ71_05770, partial [Bacteroidales bacterium]